jgi:hypothetical protein
MVFEKFIFAEHLASDFAFVISISDDGDIVFLPWIGLYIILIQG